MTELAYPSEPAPQVLSSASSDCVPTETPEMLPVVSTLGAVIGRATRGLCHGPRRLLHPVVHLHIMNREGCIFLQRRSAAKRQYPLMWDTAVGGHITYGEYAQEALFREAFEEIGLTDFNPVFLEAYVFDCPAERELVLAFAAIGDFRLEPCNEELCEGRYWSIGQIEAAMGKGVLTANFESEFRRFKSRLLSLL